MLNGFVLTIGSGEPSRSRPRFAARGNDCSFVHSHKRGQVAGHLRWAANPVPDAVATAAEGFCVSRGRASRSCSDGGGSQIIGAAGLLDGVMREGPFAFGRWQGAHSTVVVTGQAVYAIASKAPGSPLYLYLDASGGAQFSTEIKAFASGGLTIRERAISERELFQTPWLTAFENIYLIPSGYYMQMDAGQPSEFRLYPYWLPGRQIMSSDPETVSGRLLEVLESAVSVIAPHDLLCPISGGLDSSIVAALCANAGKQISTFSVGTLEHNEFVHARRLADFLKTPHREIVLNVEDLIAAYPHVIYAVEHPFSTYLEYLVPGQAGLNRAAEPGDQVVSGYGADVLFGGFALPGQGCEQTATLVNAEYRTTLWANETTAALSASHEVETHYPYFNDSVVDFAMGVAPALKHCQGWEKWVLRRAAEAILPPEIAWRRKIGVHQSTGTESAFSRYVGDQIGIDAGNLRHHKDRLALDILKRLLIEQQSPEEIAVTLLKRRV